MIETLIAYTDGGSRGNPGPSSCAAYFPQWNSVEGRFLPMATNNEAEYNGLLLALETAIGRGCKSLKICSDSELMVRQMIGHYRVNNMQLLELKVKADLLIEQLDCFEIVHIRREANKEADAECNRVMDANQ